MNHSNEKNITEKGALYLVATPIGNLSDISERALKVLGDVDFVAAEDTRNSGKLLSLFGIKKPMISYFEHNKRERGEEIARRITAGEACALITDAGMPAISDPGEDLVALCHEREIPVHIVPGACAAVSALAMSGLPTGKFIFEGFLPVPSGERKKVLESLKCERRTVIFYEAPHKLLRTLNDMLDILGDRRISICRELTKINEEAVLTTISRAADHYSANEPRGEYVLVLEGANEESIKSASFYAGMTVMEHVEYYVSNGMSKNDAMKACAKDLGVSKSEIYSKIMIKDNE